MSVRSVRVHPESYVDSVRLMSARRTMREADGVAWAAAVMGTGPNRDDLVAEGFAAAALGDAEANDLVLAVVADSEDAAATALDVGERALRGGDGPGHDQTDRQRRPRSLAQGVTAPGDVTVALVSVPGAYAVLEAHKALTAGLHVLVFSSGVPVADEIELKRRGRDSGLFVMGPDAGTALLGDVGLGFANVVDRGPVGVVAAAGTGAQEVMTLLDRWGTGPSHVIGVGGRDTSAEVGGVMAAMGLRALRSDDRTDVLLLVSKPPARQIADALLGEVAGVPVVAAFIGLDSEEISPPPGVRLAPTLEQAALAVLEVLGHARPDPTEGLVARADAALANLHGERRALRGLFSGGTLCYEAMVLASRQLGGIYSNTPLDAAWQLPAPDDAHICLDLGAEEYTQGRPHPMIDPQPRVEALRAHGSDPSTAVVLLDVVLGHGAHPDPASVLAPVCAEILRQADPPAVVTYVLGTDRDPQGLADQRDAFADAGCLLAPTNARAALLATAIVARRPELAQEAA